MTTDKIIRDEFEKEFGKHPDKDNYDACREWYDIWTGYEFAWRACEDWHERQNMMDRDYQEQIQEEARLAKGE